MVNGRDYAGLPALKKIKPGRTTATVRVVPLPDGTSGKVKLTVQPGEGYTVGRPDKVKVRITDD